MMRLTQESLTEEKFNYAMWELEWEEIDWETEMFDEKYWLDFKIIPNMLKGNKGRQNWKIPMEMTNQTQKPSDV